MLVKNPKYRKALNNNQIRLLKLVFTFRFVTVPLLAEYLGKDKSTIYEQLLTLVSQEYITKNYDSSYRLPPRPAMYHLAAKGIKYLRDTTDLSQTALRNQHKNRAASEQLVQQSLQTFTVGNQLQRQYPNQFDLFTKSQLSTVDGFVRPLPDLYLQRTHQSQAKPNSYELELLVPSIPSWLLRKRIRAHCELSDEVHYQYPHVLFVCTNDSTESRLQRMLGNVFQGFEFWTMTTERLMNGKLDIWHEKYCEDEDYQPIFKSL